MRFEDVSKELGFHPGDFFEDTMKSALLHEKIYATASTLERQMGSNPFTRSSNQPMKIKPEPAFSI